MYVNTERSWTVWTRVSLFSHANLLSTPLICVVCIYHVGMIYSHHLVRTLCAMQTTAAPCLTGCICQKIWGYGKRFEFSQFWACAIEANQTAAYGRGTDSSILYSIYVRLLWAPAQRKRATMLYFANVLFIYLFFMAALFSGHG